MSLTDSVAWALLPFDDEGELVSLAARCLGADGGLPLAADPAFLRRRWRAPGIAAIQGRDHDGRLVAAGAARPTTAVGGVTFCGLVDPAVRARGVGVHLLTWGLAEAARRHEPVTVETESLTAAAEALFAAQGLRQVFAEDVMRIDLAAGVPDPVWPVGTRLADWSAADAARFHRVYEAAFRERPGFPGRPAAEWIADVTEDDEFRPQWSVLATLADLGDAGFVTAAVDWIVQVGVAPAARGRGIGAALVTETLHRMRADGATHAWLDVNVDNSAVRLYRRLGFEHRGRRARYCFPVS
ncbi:GNAT family N-acetyltransferase [Actinoplanes sp. NPDC049599]|uniref:GNAT family N-acetyltransferase n=1 Tax=Actinoplanes sp. NPDC049599 TaxID=3363903 RepID=UPI0037B7B158